MKDGRIINRDFVELVFQQVISSIQNELGDKYSKSKFNGASTILLKLLLEEQLSDFLTTSAYPLIIKKVVRSNL